jgi:hypothetical protein
MSLESTKAAMDLATQSAKDQREASKETLTNSLDAGDRILLRKAADVSLLLAESAALGGA